MQTVGTLLEHIEHLKKNMRHKKLSWIHTDRAALQSVNTHAQFLRITARHRASLSRGAVLTLSDTALGLYILGHLK